MRMALAAILALAALTQCRKSPGQQDAAVASADHSLQSKRLNELEDAVKRAERRAEAAEQLLKDTSTLSTAGIKIDQAAEEQLHEDATGGLLPLNPVDGHPHEDSVPLKMAPHPTPEVYARQEAAAYAKSKTRRSKQHNNPAGRVADASNFTTTHNYGGDAVFNHQVGDRNALYTIHCDEPLPFTPSIVMSRLLVHHPF